MAAVIVASSSATVRREVIAAIDVGDAEIIEQASGADIIESVVRRKDVVLVIADLQMKNMGAVAVCFELRLQESYGALEHVGVLMLLDRAADEFQASRCDAEAWLIKPVDPMALRSSVRQILREPSTGDLDIATASS